MAGIGQTVGNWTRWVGNQVVGKNDFRGGDTRARDLALLGTGAGAVVGATAGVIAGFNAQKDNSVTEVWQTRSIRHPRMVGYDHHTRADYSTTCVERNKEGSCVRSETELDGWWHTYTPDIRERVVGSYTEPTFRNNNFLEPLKGGVLGAIGGGLVGLGVGLGLAALERSLKKDSAPVSPPKLSPEAEQALSTRAGVATIAGAVVGTAVGAYVGSQAGVIETAMGESHTRSWDIPVTRRETLGYIPRSHYEHNWFGSTWARPSSGSRNATEPVVRNVPVYDAAGQPRMTGAQKVFQTQRYGAVFGGLAGGAIGAGVGLAAGLAVGITDKLLAERAATRPSSEVA
jgi:hypothetical protein